LVVRDAPGVHTEPRRGGAPAALGTVCGFNPTFGGRIVMRETHITLPELALIAGTRAALGAGLGLLLADRLPDDQRRAVGWTLLLLGVVTTAPLALEVLGKSRSTAAVAG
jgi:hypothetical protein